VAAAALPLSVLPAFLGIYLFGYTLNTVTLLSLALVVGVLVDDAIVEIENIERHLRMGKTPMEAAMEAADEIGMAVIATTFALVAVFLPTAFMSGIPGLFFKQFGWTAVIAVLASLVVARLLTPMMAAYLLPAAQEERWLADVALHARDEVVPAAPPGHGQRGGRLLRRLHHARGPAADRLRAGRRPRADPDQPGTAARLHAGRNQRGRRARVPRHAGQGIKSSSAPSAAAPAATPSRPAPQPKRAAPC
jgi:multidrug efflux pump subunit AcrB